MSSHILYGGSAEGDLEVGLISRSLERESEDGSLGKAADGDLGLAGLPEAHGWHHDTIREVDRQPPTPPESPSATLGQEGMGYSGTSGYMPRFPDDGENPVDCRRFFPSPLDEPRSGIRSPGFHDDNPSFPLYGSRGSAPAGVWDFYVKEAHEFDEKMIREWNESLDVLLLFGALFSAILTAFIVASYPSLQGDNTQSTVNALVVISAQLAVMNAGQGGFSPPPFQVQPFTPSASTICVNLLWFLSLALSLMASLAVMTIKHWIRAYVNGLSSSPRPRARQRQFRFEGLLGWYVPEIINGLPTFLLVAVLLFGLGLAVFMCTVNTFLGAWMCAILFVFLIAYAILMAIPQFRVDCPYRTPASESLRYLRARIRIHLAEYGKYTLRVARWFAPLLSDQGDSPPSDRLTTSIRTFIWRAGTRISSSIEAVEAMLLQQPTPKLDQDACTWLVSTSLDDDVRDASVLRFAGWSYEGLGDIPYRMWEAASEALERRLEPLSHNTDECGSQLIPQLSEVACLSSMLVTGTSPEWLKQMNGVVPALLDLAKGRNDSNIAHSQSSRLLACIAIVHLTCFWTRDDDLARDVEQTLSDCAEAFLSYDHLPIFAGRLFLQCMTYLARNKIATVPTKMIPILSRLRYSDHPMPSDLKRSIDIFIESLLQTPELRPAIQDYIQDLHQLHDLFATSKIHPRPGIPS